MSSSTIGLVRHYGVAEFTVYFEVLFLFHNSSNVIRYFIDLLILV